MGKINIHIVPNKKEVNQVDPIDIKAHEWGDFMGEVEYT
jgi:hypothetical protein